MHHVRHDGVDNVDNDRSVWKGVVAGLAGGLVASWVMNQFQAGIAKLSSDAPGQHGRPQRQHDDENATVKAAEAVAEPALDRPLTRDEKATAGPVVHYAFGTTVGAAYGVIAEVAPRATAALGLPFGTAVWLGADEVAVPVFGLSKSPFESPASTHVSALAAHLVYGLTTDVVRRAVRAAL